jgi:hypothetical protein
VFTEIFLVQIRKIYSEIRFQGKNKFGKCVLNFKTKGKKEILRGKRGGWGGCVCVCVCVGGEEILRILMVYYPYDNCFVIENYFCRYGLLARPTK